MKTKNQNRVEHDVGNRSDQDTRHAVRRVALGVDKSVHPQRRLNKNRSQRVNAQVVQREWQRAWAGSKKIQHWNSEYLDENRQQDAKHNQENKAVRHDVLRVFFFVFAKLDRSARSPAHADQTRKGGNRHDDRHRDADPCQRKRAMIGNVADVHPVHDVVQNVDDLGDNAWQRKRKQQLDDRSGSQIDRFTFLFHQIFLEWIHAIVSWEETPISPFGFVSLAFLNHTDGYAFTYPFLSFHFLKRIYENP